MLIYSLTYGLPYLQVRGNKKNHCRQIPSFWGLKRLGIALLILRCYIAKTMRTKSLGIGVLSLLTALLIIACASMISLTPRSSQQKPSQPFAQSSAISIAAAASLQKPLQEIASFYTQRNPKNTLNYSFAASGSLQQQIEQGAPFDIFISAANKQMNTLEEKGLIIPETKKILLNNQLVLIIPKQFSMSLTRFQDLTKPDIKRVIIGEPRTVPAGQYATEVLKNLGILDAVQSKFVLGSNVRSTLTAVETGDVDAGIVYITDAKDSDKVKIVATADPVLHSPIQYPIAVLTSSQSLSRSKQYIEFLQSDSATSIFKKYGFGIAKF